MIRKHLLVTFAVAAAAVTMLACGLVGRGGDAPVISGDGEQVESQAPQGKAPTAQVGQTITSTYDMFGQKAVVEVTVTGPKLHKVEPGEYGSKPDNGAYLVVDVTVLCKEGAYPANPFNFNFVAKDGTVSSQAFTVGFKPLLSSVELSAGQKASGKIVFDVPEAAVDGGRIQLNGIGLDFDKPDAYWTL